MFQLPGAGYYEMGASQMPGLNTMANVYQQNTQQLGPSLLSYMANMYQADQSKALAMAQLEQNAADKLAQREMMAPYYTALGEQAKQTSELNKLKGATDWMQAQVGTKDPMSVYKAKAQAAQSGLQRFAGALPVLGGFFQPSQADIMAAQQAMQLQALQQAGLTPPTPVAVPKSFVPTKK